MSAPTDREFFDALTAEQVEAGITAALRAHDVDAVPGLLKMLAVKDPHRADTVLRTLQLGLAMRDHPTASVLDLVLGARPRAAEQAERETHPHAENEETDRDR